MLGSCVVEEKRRTALTRRREEGSMLRIRKLLFVQIPAPASKKPTKSFRHKGFAARDMLSLRACAVHHDAPAEVSCFRLLPEG